MGSAQPANQPGRLPYSVILKTWWPLAASWMLMAVELPLVSAVVARLPLPQISLAAWGGVIFPVALIIESPIIMLLAASTALCRDRQSFLLVRRFTLWTGLALSGLHALVAFTPLYDVVVGGLIGPPPEVLEPARLGLQLMTPWTVSIAYRRFHQGVLIRFGHSDAVGVGTGVRLTTDALVLGGGWLYGQAPGIVVAGLAVVLGVVCEAIYAGWRARLVVRDELMPSPAQDQPLTLSGFLRFYFPLALTSLLTLLIQPMGSAALSRMPRVLESLAVWPVVSGLVFMSRSLGVAYNEVVVALLDRPRSYRALRRFTAGLAVATSLALLVVATTPLSRFWFELLSGLPPALAELGSQALLFALPMPGLVVLHSWFQGTLVNRRATRGVTEAVALALVASTAVLVYGVATQPTAGLLIVWLGFDLGALVQVLWLWHRSRGSMQAMRHEEDGSAAVVPYDPVGA